MEFMEYVCIGIPLFFLLALIIVGLTPLTEEQKREIERMDKIRKQGEIAKRLMREELIRRGLL